MDYSFINNAHPSYIDNLYKKYKNDHESVPSGWKEFFLGFDYALENSDIDAEAKAQAKPSASLDTKEYSVMHLIRGYRRRGHLTSTTNPIRRRRHHFPHLDLRDFGLTKKDLPKRFAIGSEIGMPNATLQEIIDRLKEVYCGNIGFEFSYIENWDKYSWLAERIEGVKGKDYGFSIEKKKRILEKLNGAVGLENFLAKKYVAQKRFGLEGGESTIVALDGIINRAADNEVEEVVIGMAHRGRLNVLANIMNKTYEQIFNEFEGEMLPDESFGDGDVKYHLGFSSEIDTPEGNHVYLKLVPNPSHLEAVNPVVEGFTRAKADVLYKSDFDRILPILIHGDAAIAGQGLVYEVAQMSQLEGYYVGGTIHFVINNQIGFTTDFEDARSATYCTSVASVVQAPVFHVNGDDPEAVLFVAELAADYRQEFNIDVYIDMVCYRRHGHNEGDDPQFTQPTLYKAIKNHKDPRTIYTERLIASGEIGAQLAKEMNKKFDNLLQDRFSLVQETPLPYQHQKPELAWAKLKSTTSYEDYIISPKTGIPKDRVLHILNTLQKIPENFTPLRKFHRILKGKQKFLDAGLADWAMAEHLAYGSILMDGNNIRMSGQDVKRGTFSHRNAIMVDAETNEQYNRLNHLSKDQGKFQIHNSLLSEFAVLGFEFGYSLASPAPLVVWEAQFGDFANGAQTIFDQFICSSESKWQRMTGLMLLLPHGYEGQGPEHSSAKLERYLQACAEFNMTVANVTTPANFFHLVRRQLARPFRKPLVVMSPKSMLRHPKCVSSFDDFAEGTRFTEVFDDPDIDNKEKARTIKKVLCCSGKIYFDLLARKEANDHQGVAIVRLEQLYPFPKKQVNYLLLKYQNAKFFWVQEEPSNMGAWQYILAFYRNYDLKLISRKSSASPATGFKQRHQEEQKNLVDRAFAPVEIMQEVVNTEERELRVKKKEELKK